MDFYGEISCLRTPPFKFFMATLGSTTSPASLSWDAVRRAWAVNGGTAGAVHTDHYRLEETWRGVA